MANYATAIFLGVVFVIFSIISKKKWTMVFWISICVLAVVLLSPYISEFFLRISKWNISEHLQSKAYQVAMSLKGKKVNYNTFDIRMEYMKNASIGEILKNKGLWDEDLSFLEGEITKYVNQ